jgi:hypothetical protein
MLNIIAFATGLLIGAAIVFAGWRKVTVSPDPKKYAEDYYDRLVRISNTLDSHIDRLRKVTEQIEDQKVRVNILYTIGFLLDLDNYIIDERIAILNKMSKL